MNKQPSRTGKDKKTGKETKEKSIKSTEKQITTLCEIVPGKFNENDWNILLDTDDAQDFVLDLIDEVFDNVTKIIYERYLDKQTIPFTTNEAKKAILHIIDWQFLNKDHNDDLSESFLEDTEPDACIIDSWAQGYVQAYEYDSSQHENNEKLNEKEQEDKQNQFLKELNKIIDEPKDNESSKLDQSDLIGNESSLSKSFTKKKTQKPKVKKIEIVEVDEEKEKEQAEKKKDTHRLKKVDPETKRIDESISKAPQACQASLKSLLNRPESKKEIDIFSDGTIKFTTKLDFDKLPGQTVKAKFSINETQKFDHESLRRSKISMISNSDSNEKHTNSLSTFDAYLGNKNIRITQKTKRSLYDDEELVLEPAPGVTFTVQNSTRIGPKRQLVPSRQQILYEKSENYLKPVKQSNKSDLDTKRSLNEILDGYPLLTKPEVYNQLKRIPPISNSTAVS